MHATRIGAALLGAALLAGCSASSDPRTALAHALDGMATGKYSFDVTFPREHMTGSIDQPDHQATWTATSDDQPGRIISANRVIGEDLYVTAYGGGGLGDGRTPVHEGSWRHFDLTRETADDDPLRLFHGDVETLQPLVKSLVATAVHGRTVQATIDLSGYGRSPGISPEMSMLTTWGTHGPIPATVQLDDQGRLTSLTAALPVSDAGDPGGRLTIKLTAYGATVAPPPPPTMTYQN